MENQLFESEKSIVDFEAQKVKLLIEENLRDLQTLNINKDPTNNK
jgi:hypothetical protein